MAEYYYSSKEIIEKAIGTDAYFQIKSILTSTKAADVAPLRHGRWFYPNGKVWNYVCSECGKANSAIKHNYCPNCGAKMDMEEW